MQIKIDQKVLADATMWVSRAFPSKNDDIIATSIALEANLDGTLSLTVYNYDAFATCTIAGDVTQDGKIVTPGKKFAEICKTLPLGDVNITATDTRLTIKASSFVSNLPLVDLDIYPELPQVPAPSIEVAASVFANAINQTYIATSREENSASLSSLKITFDGEVAEMLSTDRYRLAKRTFNYKATDEEVQYEMLLPKKEANEIARALENQDLVQIGVNAKESKVSFASFATKNMQIGTSTYDALFPAIDSLFNVNYETLVTVSRKALIDAIRRVSVVVSVDSHLRLTFLEENIILRAGNEESSDATESIKGTREGGDEITVACNPSYLLDGLNAIVEPNVQIRINDSIKPFEISGVTDEGKQNADYRYVMVPIRM